MVLSELNSQNIEKQYFNKTFFCKVFCVYLFNHLMENVYKSLIHIIGQNSIGYVHITHTLRNCEQKTSELHAEKMLQQRSGSCTHNLSVSMYFRGVANKYQRMSGLRQMHNPRAAIVYLTSTINIILVKKVWVISEKLKGHNHLHKYIYIHLYNIMSLIIT